MCTEILSRLASVSLFRHLTKLITNNNILSNTTNNNTNPNNTNLNNNNTNITNNTTNYISYISSSGTQKMKLYNVKENTLEFIPGTNYLREGSFSSENVKFILSLFNILCPRLLSALEPENRSN